MPSWKTNRATIKVVRNIDRFFFFKCKSFLTHNQKIKKNELAFELLISDIYYMWPHILKKQQTRKRMIFSCMYTFVMYTCILSICITSHSQPTKSKEIQKNRRYSLIIHHTPGGTSSSFSSFNLQLLDKFDFYAMKVMLG